MADTKTEKTVAEELREAASRLRGESNGATPGPWRRHDTHLDVGGHTATVLISRPGINDFELVAWLPSWSHEPWADQPCWSNSRWIALVHPGLAGPLVSWLESCAGQASTMRHPDDWGICDEPGSVRDALAVARTLNGGAP